MSERQDMMRAVVCREFGPPSSLEEITIPLPAPDPDQVRVRVTATGIGFVDGLLIQGLYQVKPPLPYFPGNEFAGVVEAVGENCTALELGTRVFGVASSTLSDYICVPPAACNPTPERLTDADAAGFYLNYLTAVYGLQRCGNLCEGETVLVLGASGGVGSSGIAVAKALGATVIAAASTEEKRAGAVRAGADLTVDYSAPDWRDDLRTRLDGRPLDVVYDPVGGAATEAALRSLSPGGRHLVVGFASGTIPTIPLNLPLLKRCSIVGVDWGGDSRQNPDLNQPLLTKLTDLLNSGKLTPAPVTPRPSTDYVRALEDQLAGRIIGKLVLTR